VCGPLAVDECKLDFTIAKHMRDGRRGELKIHRDRNRAHAHHAQICDDELEPILRNDADALTGAYAAIFEAPRSGHDQSIELQGGDFARLIRLTRIDVRRQPQDVAEIAKLNHAGSS
jgi:hypothetical protein